LKLSTEPFSKGDPGAIRGFRAHRRDSLARSLGDKFGAVLAANMFGRAARQHEIGQHVDDVARTPDRQRSRANSSTTQSIRIFLL
jgi:hypothetical protein